MSRRLTYKYVKNIIELEDYKLLSEEYIDNKAKLKLQCPEGHIFDKRFNDFQQGQRCPICSRKKMVESQRHSYSFVKSVVESRGYKLLSEKYIRNHDPLKVLCPEGHEYTIIFSSFQRGTDCQICMNNQRYTHNHVKNIIESEGYKLLSEEYKNSKQKLKVSCPEGHEYDVRYNDFQQGCRCPICWSQSTSSKIEEYICSLVKTLTGYEVLSNNRDQIINPLTNQNLELDIWIPELRKAIEFNGIFWHSSKYSKAKDKIKKEQCLVRGIDLLVIEEKDWLTNKEGCVRKIRSFIWRKKNGRI